MTKVKELIRKLRRKLRKENVRGNEESKEVVLAEDIHRWVSHLMAMEGRVKKPKVILRAYHDERNGVDTVEVRLDISPDDQEDEMKIECVTGRVWDDQVMTLVSNMFEAEGLYNVRYHGTCLVPGWSIGLLGQLIVEAR